MFNRYTRFSYLRNIISAEYGSPIRRYVTLLPMHGASRSYLRSHQLHLLLDAYYRSSVHILQETVELMSPPNDVPYKCRIAVCLKTNSDREEELQLFVKLLTDDPDDLIKIANAYMRVDQMIKMKKEIQIYTVVIAAIEKFQNQMKIKKEFRYKNVFANFIGARLSFETTTANLPDQFSAILLDTPEFRYYKTKSNGTVFTGFDFFHAKMIIRDMARFHACPIAMKIKNEKKFRKKVMSFLNLEVKDFEKLPPSQSLCHELLTDGLKHKPEVLHQMPFLRESLQLSRLSEWIQEDHEDKTWHTLCHSRYCIPNIITSYPSRELPRRSKLLELGKRSIAEILISVKASSCEGYDETGQPILGENYRRRVKVAVRLAAGLM
ncbi:uncharacterized protein LOC109543206 [Dendroctonus ponderosae]|uniref:uncharacterized protein LOC109543206 n=1 Tax=Dendroctonus ponderosae TaxID=77166 RepID=UPI002036081B|nr:uncharacterized protein LOC109543206 [Dendroctonus ponderosae]